MKQKNFGYPYMYGDQDSEKNSIIFSLNKLNIEKEQQLKLTLASSVPVSTLVESSEFTLGDEFSYQFCQKISEVCGVLDIIPQTQTIVLDYNGFCKIVSQSDIILETLSSNLGVTDATVREQAQKFFQNKNVIVQATGLQGSIYRMGAFLQSGGSTGIIVRTIGMAQLAGVNGLQVLRAQPYLAIALPTTGAIFFYGCGLIAGNNTIGKALITVGDGLALPMKGVELLWNSYGNPIIKGVFGIPVILNMTQTLKTGPGYTLEEIQEYVLPNKTSIVRILKDKLIKWLSR